MSSGSPPSPTALAQLVDRAEIHDTLCRYAHAVDRGDWGLLRATYHADAYDDHGDYKGGVDGLVDWLTRRFAGVDNSMHLLGNCRIAFETPDIAQVETYFVSRRLRPPTPTDPWAAGSDDAVCREVWGRYVDRFERRDGAWRVAHRTVVLEAISSTLAVGGRRPDASRSPAVWGRRDGRDPAQIAFGTAAQASR